MPASNTTPDLAAATRAASRSASDGAGSAPGTAHLIVDGVSRSYGDRRVLSDISFTAKPGDRIGLIGENGTGKSTLLRIIAAAGGSAGGPAGDTAAGRASSEDPPARTVGGPADDPGSRPDSGTVALPGSVGLLAQQLPYPDETPLGWVLDDAQRTALDALERIERLGERFASHPDDPEVADAYARALEDAERTSAWSTAARRGEILFGLGLGGIAEGRPIGELSGGQRLRLALAALLLTAPQTLLLDEPSNHLDDASAAYLERVLAGWPGIVIVASHDRALLDAVSTRILDLDALPLPAQVLADAEPVASAGRVGAAGLAAHSPDWVAIAAEASAAETHGAERAVEGSGASGSGSGAAASGIGSGSGSLTGSGSGTGSRSGSAPSSRPLSAPGPHDSLPAGPVTDDPGSGFGVRLWGVGYSAARAARQAEMERWRARYAAETAEREALIHEIEVGSREVNRKHESKSEAKITRKFYADKDARVTARRARNARVRLDVLERERVRRPPEPLRFAGFGAAAPRERGVPHGQGLAPRGSSSPGDGRAGGAVAELDPTRSADARGEASPSALIRADRIALAGRLRPTSFELPTGGRLMLTGPNGSGKSTLLAILAHRLDPDRGELEIASHARVGYLPQEVEFEHADRSAERVYRDAVGVDTADALPLHETGLLARRDVGRPVGALSMGQRRRLALAALVADPPDVLLLDEPTNHLSLTLVEELETALREFTAAPAASTGLVIATHDRWLRSRWEGEVLDLAGE